ncbi:MAG TPA: hypothetical protein VF665_14540 [Longimicrobium sp.]|jgi:hypothetical protein
MALADFQRAIVALAASPELCARVRAGDDAEGLRGYTLTERERMRLRDAAGQRGMTVNAMLYRSNRLAPLASQLRYTCFLLGTAMRGLASAYWAQNPVVERNAPTEVRRFAAFVRGRIAAGEVEDPLVGEVLEWEMEGFELALLAPRRTMDALGGAAERARADAPLRTHPLVGVARFSREPGAVLGALAAKRPLPYDDLLEGVFHLVMDARTEPRSLRMVPAATAAAFRALRAGRLLSRLEAEDLVDRGLVIAAE